MTLIVIFGPMFAGKTTEMIRFASQHYYVHGKKSLFVTCSIDTREPIKRISSHFKFYTCLEDLFDIITLEKDQLCKLKDMDLSQYSCICIDETQFFDHLWENINLVSKNNVVICSGLKATFERKPFKEFNDLFSLADHLVECKAFCVLCKNENNPIANAVHTRKSKKSKDIIEIGGSDIYQPVCAKHFIDE